MSIFFVGCDENLEFPAEPTVAFERMSWRPGVDGMDSLVLTFSFTDGDGDLGLSEYDVDAPYHPFDLIVDANNEVVTLHRPVMPPFYTLNPQGEKELFAAGDIREAFNERNYLLVDSLRAGDESAADTLIIRRNIFHNNIYVRCFKKENGRYVPFDKLGLSGEEQIHGRFASMEKVLKQPPPVGLLRFPFAAPNFLRKIRADTLRFQFYVFDRSLNQSNLATSPDMTVVDILTSNSQLPVSSGFNR